MKMKDKVTESGVHIVDIIDGVGKPALTTDKVAINYTGYLEDGNIFDSNVGEGKDSFEFILGQYRVIKGWEEAILGMKVGTKCTIIIPPELGYGDRGVGPIPGNAVLIFDIEVMKITRVQKELEKQDKKFRERKAKMQGEIK